MEKVALCVGYVEPRYSITRQNQTVASVVFLETSVAQLTLPFHICYVPINSRFIVDYKIYSRIAKQFSFMLWHQVLIHMYLWKNLTMSTLILLTDLFCRHDFVDTCVDYFL